MAVLKFFCYWIYINVYQPAISVNVGIRFNRQKQTLVEIFKNVIIAQDEVSEHCASAQ